MCILKIIVETQFVSLPQNSKKDKTGINENGEIDGKMLKSC